MNPTVSLPPDVAAYLDQLRAALADLPADERDEMLADVEVSLLEDPADPPEIRLGPPERFAQELRAAAGLEAATAPAPAPTPKPGVRERIATAIASPRGQAAQATARELAPIWWFARGFLAACAVVLFAGVSWSPDYALLPGGPPLFSFVLVLGAIAGSIWLGLRTRREGTRRWIQAMNVALAIFAIPVLAQISDGRASVAGAGEYYYEPPPHPQGVTVDGEPVKNIYPYSREGKLLFDVVLFDDLGRPLEIGSSDLDQDPLRRYLFDRDGKPLLNAFPIRYVEPGTSRVAEPTATPEGLEPPKVVTPPLKVKRP